MKPIVKMFLAIVVIIVLIYIGYYLDYAYSDINPWWLEFTIVLSMGMVVAHVLLAFVHFVEWLEE